MRQSKLAVAGIVVYENKILLGKKVEKPGKLLSGLWHIPGETLEKKESDLDALARGMREEAGIEIEVLKYLATSKTPSHTFVNWYECLALTYDIRHGSDLQDVMWVSKEEALTLCKDTISFLWPNRIKEYFLI